MKKMCKKQPTEYTNYIKINLKLIIGFVFAIQTSMIAQTVRYDKTESGLEFGLYVNNENKKPAPVLFILGGTLDATINSNYARQCGNRLTKENGWLCVSIDLPFHGKLKPDSVTNELAAWGDAARRKVDFVTPNNKKMREILEYLIRKGEADSNHVYACGISRGGYLALQFAAVEPRVKAIVGFSPVSDPMALHEFAGVKLLPVFNLDHCIDSLANRDIWLVIGDRDERVGTDRAVSLARKISRAGQAAHRNKIIELHVISEPQGHNIPEGSDEKAADWFLERYKKNKGQK